MSSPPLSADELRLLAANAFQAQHEVAYAQLDGDLRLLAASPNLHTFIDPAILNIPVTPEHPWQGYHVSELFLAFFGAESALLDVLNGRLPHYRLDHVNRVLADGSTGYVSFHVSAISGGQSAASLLLLVEDSSQVGALKRELIQDRNELRLTQSRLARTNESLRQLDRLKSLFLSMAAHDLRTPLSSIYGYVDFVLQMGGLPPGSRVYRNLQVVLSQTRWLNRLIANFLDLNLIEEGKLTIQPTWTALHESVDDVVEVLLVRLQSNSQHLDVDLPPAPCQVWVDPTKLTQILFNLTGNAIKYTPEGSHIAIAAHYEDDGGIRISVSDNGPGMTADQVERLYSLYYRTEDAQRQGASGTGLGLYIVKMLVEAHGGRVGVNSQPGQGSTFFFRLPPGPKAAPRQPTG